MRGSQAKMSSSATSSTARPRRPSLVADRRAPPVGEQITTGTAAGRCTVAVVADDEFPIRPGHENELALALDIDDDACVMFVDFDPRFDLSLPDDHPFVVAERSRWADAARLGRLLFACTPSAEPVGFVALGYVDGQPIVEQLSVRRAWTRRRIGRALLDRARRWSTGSGQLWLTTYASVPWNGPWYERMGFTRADPATCGPELLARFEHERDALPAADQRVAMVYRHRYDA